VITVAFVALLFFCLLSWYINKGVKKMSATVFSISGEVYTPPTAFKNFAKGKAVLDKLARYGGADSRYTMLMKTFAEDRRSSKNPISTCSMKLELWTIPKDNLPELEQFLRTEPFGMCTHTQRTYEGVPQIEWVRGAKEVKGLCNRRECQATSLEKLLHRYMLGQIRNPNTKEFECIMKSSMYKNLDEFSSKFDIIKKDLFEYQPDESKGEKYSVGDIRQNKLKSVKDSHGQVVYEFGISVNRDSKVERLKNNLRPAFGRSKRASTQRNPLIHRFAHADKSTLRAWQRQMDEALRQESVSKAIQDKVPDLEEFLEMKFDCDAPPSSDDYAERTDNFQMDQWQDCWVRYNPTAERGTEDELIKGTMTVPFDILDLFYMLVPFEKELEKHLRKGDLVGGKNPKTLFELYLFGYNYDPKKIPTEHLVDPPMESGHVVENFGQELQSILVLSERREKLPSQGVFENYLPSKIARSLGPILKFSGMVEAYDDNFKRDHSDGSAYFTRSFTLKKEYFTEDDRQDPLSNFSLLYTDTKREEHMDNSKVIGTTGYQAKIGKLMLKFEKNQDDEYSKDDLRQNALNILNEFLKDDISMNDDGLNVQKQALKSLLQISEDVRSPSIEQGVMKILKRIIHRRIMPKDSLHDESARDYNDGRHRVHIYACKCLEQIVKNRLKYGRVDLNVFGFLKLAIDAVNIDDEVVDSKKNHLYKKPSDRSKATLQNVVRLARKIINDTFRTRTKALYDSVNYSLIQKQAESLETYIDGLNLDHRNERNDVDKFVAAMKKSRDMFAVKQKQILMFQPGAKYSQEDVKHIPYIVMSKGVPTWKFATYRIAERQYYGEDKKVLDIEKLNTDSFDYSKYEKKGETQKKPKSITAVSDKKLKQYEPSSDPLIAAAYGQIENVLDDMEKQVDEVDFVIPRGIPASELTSLTHSSDEVYIYEKLSGTDKEGSEQVTLTIRGPQSRLDDAHHKVWEFIVELIDRKRYENVAVPPRKEIPGSKPTKYFLKEAMDKLIQITKLKTADDYDVKTDKLLQVQIIEALRKILSSATDSRTTVHFVMETSGAKLWGPAIEHVWLEDLAKVYFKDIMDSVGKALSRIDRVFNDDDHTIRLNDYINGRFVDDEDYSDDEEYHSDDEEEAEIEDDDE